MLEAMFLRRLLSPLLLGLAVSVAGSPVASAHGGFENDTEVRLLPDRMRVVVRTSYSFAAMVLGESAAPLADPSYQEAARARLAQAAPTLWEVSAGSRVLQPIGTDGAFEPHGDVAFILTFERPIDFPLVFKAHFFPRLGSLETGTVKIFDQTADRFRRDSQPITAKTLRAGDVSLTLNQIPPPLADPALPTSESLATTAHPAALAPRPSASMILLAAGSLFLLAILLGWWLRHRQRQAP